MSDNPSSTTLDPEGAERNFRIVSAHLKKAHQSNELATRLQQKGFVQDAQRQSQLTKVFITNAMHHVSQQCQRVDI
jgi:hypothetical protein